MNLIKLALFSLSAFGIATSHADVNAHFNQIRNNPDALYKFFKTMPKGGELHYHLDGGPYPETMLSLVSKSDYCLDPTTFAVTPSFNKCQGVSTQTIQENSSLYNKIISSWSMKGFTPGKESGHDHFFNSFMKFIPIVMNHRPQLIANVMERAAAQNEHYLELMDSADNTHSASFGEEIKQIPTFAKKRAFLLKNPKFQQNIVHTVEESDRVLAMAKQELGCSEHPQTKACHVQIKILYFVLREQPINNVFAQALNGFEAVSRSKGTLVGINLVQAEDGAISLRDYKEQMKIFNYLKSQYPNVPIALHAGEIAPDLVAAKELTFHVHDALFVGKAQRIGHGVDITHEPDAENTVAYMAEHHIPVEINLISNKHILNISGSKHPLNYYLAHQVPVVFSTDDEGILRTDLTEQYVAAVLEHHLDYPTLRQINRNTLTYAFVPGKSIWIDANKAIRVPACQDLKSQSCVRFIAQSEKARMQWELENELERFESSLFKN